MVRLTVPVTDALTHSVNSQMMSRYSVALFTDTVVGLLEPSTSRPRAVQGVEELMLLKPTLVTMPASATLTLPPPMLPGPNVMRLVRRQYTSPLPSGVVLRVFEELAKVCVLPR